MRVVLLTLAALMLVAVTVSAQRDLFFVDDTGRLNQEAIIEAADPLLMREATVAVYVVTGEGDLLQHLRTDDLIDASGRLRDSAIIVYISIDPDHHEIRYGEQWRAALQDRLPDYEANLLPVLLDQNEYEVAVTNTLATIESAIVLEESENQEWVIYVVIAGVALAMIFGFVRFFYMLFRGIFRFGRQLSQ